MAKGQKHVAELRERAVRLVLEHEHKYPSRWKAICSVTEKLDGKQEALRLWVHRAGTPMPGAGPG